MGCGIVRPLHAHWGCSNCRWICWAGVILIDENWFWNAGKGFCLGSNLECPFTRGCRGTFNSQFDKFSHRALTDFHCCQKTLSRKITRKAEIWLGTLLCWCPGLHLCSSHSPNRFSSGKSLKISPRQNLLNHLVALGWQERKKAHYTLTYVTICSFSWEPADNPETGFWQLTLETTDLPKAWRSKKVQSWLLADPTMLALAWKGSAKQTSPAWVSAWIPRLTRPHSHELSAITTLPRKNKFECDVSSDGFPSVADHYKVPNLSKEEGYLRGTVSSLWSIARYSALRWHGLLHTCA